MVVLAHRIALAPRAPRKFSPEVAWIFLVLFPVLFSLIILDEKNTPPTADCQPPLPTVTADSTVTITMSFIGDLMCHVPQINNAKKSDGTYDFNPSFKEITPYLSAADVTMANLECTFAGSGRPYQGYPAFNAPDAYLAAIKNAGVDFLCMSNNHSMDTGEEGLQRTLKKVRENGFASCGTFDSQRDRDSIRILDIKGVRVAVLNYTYGTNGAYPIADHKYMLNVADSALVRADVLRARRSIADLVLVFYHWGEENKQEPVAKQDSMFHWAADAGADLVIGAHPHVLEPVAYFKTAPNARLDSGIVAWSLGNFLSNQYWRYTDVGVILNLSIQKNFTTGKVSLQQTEYFPTAVCRSNDNSIQQHVIIPAGWCHLDSLPSWINAPYKPKLCEGFSDTKIMMNKYSPKPQLLQYYPPSDKSPFSPDELAELIRVLNASKKDTVHHGDGSGNPGISGGSGNGNGYVADTCGRRIINDPPIDIHAAGKATVWLQVWIDRQGTVVKVIVWDAKFTVNDDDVLIRARAFGKELRYNPDPSCAELVTKIVQLEFIPR